MAANEQTNYDDNVWNMASAYLKRVDRLLTLCDHCQMLRDIHGWAYAIEALFKEVYPKMLDKEKKLANKYRLRMHWQLKNPNYQVFKGSTRPVATYPQTPFLNFELYLRELLEKKNLLTPKGADATKAFRG